MNKPGQLTFAEDSLSLCEQHYNRQADAEKPIVLLVMAIGLESCRSSLQVVLQNKSLCGVKRDHLIDEAVRRYQILSASTSHAPDEKPTRDWNTHETRNWLERHPIEGHSNTHFVQAKLDSTHFGLAAPPSQPSHVLPTTNRTTSPSVRTEAGGNDNSSNNNNPTVNPAAATTSAETTVATRVSSSCEIFLSQQAEDNKPTALFLMAIGLPDCQSTVDMILRYKSIVPSKKLWMAEAQRRHRLHYSDVGSSDRPTTKWNITRTKAWLLSHPIRERDNIDFVTTRLESDNYGLDSICSRHQPIPEQQQSNQWQRCERPQREGGDCCTTTK